MSTEPLKTGNMDFLLERLARDCAPMQQYRELTQNAIEAVCRLSGTIAGQIVWDVDEVLLRGTDGTNRKLCITDNGDGMSPAEMAQHVNNLSSSGSIQSLSGNYGLGAKIAAGATNPHGLVYQSWREGCGNTVRFWKDPDSRTWGLQRFEVGDGRLTSHRPVADDERPASIGSHGTRVVLLGASDTDDTTIAPEGQTKHEWLSKYLNTRYFEFPSGVTVRVRSSPHTYGKGSGKPPGLRPVLGMASYLKDNSTSSGQVQLKGAVARWWILQPIVDRSQNEGERRRTSVYEQGGHVAALYSRELYEIARGNAGKARLNEFGLLFNSSRVVIYVEPDINAEEGITTNAARTHLLLGSEPLPWSEWAAEFRKELPKELIELEEETSKQDQGLDHNEAVREMLTPLLDLYRITRKRLQVGGVIGTSKDEDTSPADEGHGDQPGIGDYGDEPVDHSPNPRPRPKRHGGPGGLYGNRPNGDDAAVEVQPDPLPRVEWVSQDKVAKDRAAHWAPQSNVILANADFRGFLDLEDRIVRSFCGDKPGLSVRTLVRDTVHKWISMSLVEAVMGARALTGRPDWMQDDVDRALSDEALTAVSMPRYHVLEKVRREIATKIGKLKDAA
jgi:hypothetical protein